jgi:glycosyltransferase involved in cell wall biosynthesis
MKILLVNKFVYPKGGADCHVLDLARLLEEQGHEVSLFGMRHPKNPSWPDDDLFVSFMDFEHPRNFEEKLRGFGRLLYSFEAKRKFGALLDRRKPDVIHVHNIYHQISPAILSEAKKRHIPVVMTLHDLKLLAPNYLLYHDGKVCEITKPDRFFRAVNHRCVKGSRLGSLACALETWLHRRLGLYAKSVDAFVSPSQFHTEKLREYKVPMKRLEVIPNFFSTRTLPRTSDQGYALYAGRLSDEKGVTVLLDAWKYLPNVPMKIAGDGPLEGELKRLVRELNLTNVEFLGHLSSAELDLVIAGARMILVPSVCYENQPLAILEAFQFGKPVVASRIGGIPELVQDNVNGKLVAPGDAKALAEAVAKLWSDAPLREAMSKANLAKATEFTHEHYLESIIPLYEELVAAKSQG